MMEHVQSLDKIIIPPTSTYLRGGGGVRQNITLSQGVEGSRIGQIEQPLNQSSNQYYRFIIKVFKV